MRIWTVPYVELDNQRLLGQHREVHMLIGFVSQGGIWADPFGGDNRLDVSDLPYLRWVHELTVQEMLLRDMRGHQTPVAPVGFRAEEERFMDRLILHQNRIGEQQMRDRWLLWLRWGAEYKGRGDIPSQYADCISRWVAQGEQCLHDGPVEDLEGKRKGQQTCLLCKRVAREKPSRSEERRVGSEGGPA